MATHSLRTSRHIATQLFTYNKMHVTCNSGISHPCQWHTTAGIQQ